MLKKITPYIVFMSMLLFLFFLYGFSSMRNGAKKISDIEIQFKGKENPFLTYDLVNKLLIQNNKNVKNQLKSSLDLHDLEKVVNKNFFVEKATVCTGLHNQIYVFVKQRVPVARIVSSKYSYYVDAFGYKFPLSSNFSARVPLVTGLNSEKDIANVLYLLDNISKDDFLTKEIVAIKKSRHNNYELSVRSGDYKIDIGKLVDLDIKFRKLKAFYNTALINGEIKKYSRIVVKYNNQVVCLK